VSGRLRIALVAAALLATLGAGRAAAEPGPIELASANGVEQADLAVTPALSADGGFLAFVGQIGGFVGLFRKDLRSGEVLPVFTRPLADQRGPEEVALEPSISADGRYVSFTTREQIDPADDVEAGTFDVYVADMSEDPVTYELASALDGCDPRAPGPHEPCGLSYAEPNGSVASGRVSLSGDGREVAFVTASPSNLTGPRDATETPPFQVAVRNLETARTTLVSVERDPLTGAMEEGVPVQGGAVLGERTRLGASLSSDGSTVSWIGIEISRQAAIPADEAAAVREQDEATMPYDDPLWRRVPQDGAAPPPISRVASGGAFPSLLSGSNQEALSLCNGVSAIGWDLSQGAPAAVPALSADGDEVALIGEPSGYVDAYLVNMVGGAQPRALTRAVPAPENNACKADPTTAGNVAATAGAITSVAISAGGDRIAFTTDRQQYPLSPPTLIGAPPLRVGLPELYLIDLREGTMERLTHGFAGGSGEPSLLIGEPLAKGTQLGADSVSFDAGGETLAFASTASNLVADDGNGVGGRDAFLVADPRDRLRPGSTTISSPPAAIATRSRWALTARASSLPDGDVRVAASVPGAGSLRASAAIVARRPRVRGRIAKARRGARLASVLVFDLRPAHRFRTRVRAPGGVEANLRLVFRGYGGKALHGLLHVRFRAHPKRRKGGGG
jgi:hypothetical protein